MSLAAAKADLKSKLRTAMNWTGSIVEEYETPSSMPFIQIYTGTSNFVTLSSTVSATDIFFEMLLPLDDTAGLEFHRDPHSAAGLLGALMRLRFCGSFTHDGTFVDLVEDDTEAGKIIALRVTVSGKLYVTGS